MPLRVRWLRFLLLRAQSWPLAFTRVAIGLCSFGVAWEAWRSLSRMLAPEVVELPYLAWLPRLPAAALPALAAAWFMAASAFVIGLQTRLAGGVILCLSTYTLLLDQRTYSNHLYLFALIVLLLTVADSGAAFSIDASRSGSRDTVAAWPIFLLKAQASLVYGFSAVAKLTSPFVSGDVLGQTLRTQGLFVFPTEWRTPALMATLSIIAIALESFVAVGLWHRQLRWPAVAIGVCLHAFMVSQLDSSRLALGIFALELFAIYPLFFADLTDPRES